MDCSKRCAGAVANLPNDPLVEILSRTPAKSICRFKCVSKAWRDLIADPLHRKKLPQTLEGFFFDGEHDKLHFVNVLGIFMHHVNPCFPFMTELSLPGNIILLDGSNGLLLFGCFQELNESVRYIVSNPATNQWVVVPRSGRKWPLTYGCGELNSLIFDPVISSHFHLVRIIDEIQIVDEAMVDVYSSESGVWSPGRPAWGDLCLDYGFSSVYCNGMLYVALSGLRDERYHIAVMDVKGNTSKIIPVPFQVGDELLERCHYVGQSQGRLHYICHADNAEIPPEKKSYELFIWILEDYEAQQWVLKDTLSFSHLFGERSCEIYNVAVHPDGNLIYLFLILGSSQKRIPYLISYNMNNKEVRHICKLGCGYRFVPHVPYFSELSSLENKS